MRDVLLITVECLRYDYRQECSVFDELNTKRCISCGHYTRPSLAGLLSAQYSAALAAKPQTPTLAQQLSQDGYHTIGVSHSPQTTPALGFDTGFDEYHHEFRGQSTGRSSGLRERLANYAPVRALHRRLRPKTATFESIPRDEEAIETVIDAYDSADGPTFLWAHLMGSHRPYGWDDPLPAALSRRAAASGESRLSRSLSDRGAKTVREYYKDSLPRVGRHAASLVDAVADDAIVIVVGDHGEELGEDAYWFHAPYRQRTVDAITEVPIGVRNVSIGEQVSHVDIAPMIINKLGLSEVAEWGGSADGQDNSVTVAPWAGSASVRWHGATEMRFENAEYSIDESTSVSGDTKQRLAALGYAPE